MSSLDSFDNVIKGRLQNYASEPPPGMFRKIQEARKPDPNNKPISVFWLYLSLAALIGLISYTAYSHLDMLATNKTVTQTNKAEVPSLKNKATDALAINADSEEILRASEDESWSEESKESSRTLLNELPNNDEQFKIQKARTETVLSNKSERSSAFLATANTAEIKEDFSMNASSGSAMNEIKAMNFESDANLENSIAAGGIITEGFEYSSKTWDISREQIIAERSIKNHELKALDFIAASSLENSQFAPLAEPKKVDVGCVNFNGNVDNSNVSFDVVFAPEYAIRTLSTEDTELQNFVVGRENSESFEIAFHSGFRISNKFKNGIALRTGLYFSQIQETFDWEEIQGTQTTVDITIDSIYNSVTGVLEEVKFDTITTTQQDIRHVRAYNKYKMVDIPLIVGYEFNRRRLSLSFNVGALINLSFHQRGKILSYQNNEPRNILDPTQDQLFKTQLGLGVIGSFGLAYRFTNRCSFLLEPTFRYYLQDFNSDTNPVQQKYLMTGLSTGLRYHF